MPEAYICDFVGTPIGRYGGALKDARADNLGAHPLRVSIRSRRRGGDAVRRDPPTP